MNEEILGQAFVLWPDEKWVELHDGITTMDNALEAMRAAIEDGAEAVRFDTFTGDPEDLVIWKPE